MTIESSRGGATSGLGRVSMLSNNHQWIVTLSEGRGIQGEIGLAAIDLKTCHIKLSQFPDTPTYSVTIQMLNRLNPTQIIVSQSMVSPVPSKMYQVIHGLVDCDINVLERAQFSDAKGLDIIQNYAVNTILDLELTRKYYCLAALGALLSFVDSEHGLSFAKSSIRFKYECPGDYLLIDSVTARNLELVESMDPESKSLHLMAVMNFTKTKMGSRLLRKTILQPESHSNLIEIEGRLDAVEELMRDSRLSVTLSEQLTPLTDVDHLISELIQIPRHQNVKSAEMTVNSMVKLKHNVHQIVRLVEEMGLVTSERLIEIYQTLFKMSESDLMDDIVCVLNDNVRFQKDPLGLRNQHAFAVRNEASSLLQVARQTFNDATESAHQLTIGYTEDYHLPFREVFNKTPGFSLALKQADLTCELGRPFINIVKKQKQIHCTTLKLMSLNERIEESLAEIYLISDKLIADLLIKVRSYLPLLYEVSEALAMLDMLLSFAHVADLGAYVRPEFTSALAIKSGRHPLLEKMDPNLTPNDTFADSRSRYQIVTGPNNAGKSMYLKQIGLLVIMAHMGSFVPAQYCSCPPIDALFTRMGNDDCLEANSSTFMVEMRETVYILEHVTPKSLVMIDELGRGTSISDGVGICMAVCERLLKLKPIVFMVTHFEELAVNIQAYPDCALLQLDSQMDHDRYTYRVREGRCTLEHYGVLIAQQIGLSPSILDRAKSLSNILSMRSRQLIDQNEETRAYQKCVCENKLIKTLLHIHHHSKLDREFLLKLYRETRESFLGNSS